MFALRRQPPFGVEDFRPIPEARGAVHDEKWDPGWWEGGGRGEVGWLSPPVPNLSGLQSIPSMMPGTGSPGASAPSIPKGSPNEGPRRYPVAQDVGVPVKLDCRAFRGDGHDAQSFLRQGRSRGNLLSLDATHPSAASCGSASPLPHAYPSSPSHCLYPPSAPHPTLTTALSQRSLPRSPTSSSFAPGPQRPSPLSSSSTRASTPGWRLTRYCEHRAGMTGWSCMVRHTPGVTARGGGAWHVPRVLDRTPLSLPLPLSLTSAQARVLPVVSAPATNMLLSSDRSLASDRGPLVLGSRVLRSRDPSE
uniref:Uncharacterized protein n=1 Tax=Auxenochlorella protothecoides TaxID=3075 RepID=A0A1D2A8R6_AUXPR